MSEKPNFILIMSDQHRGDCLGVEGHPVLLTPTLDALAGSGMRFTRAYSPCPVCIPARRSFLSGQFPATHGMVGMVDGAPWYPSATLPGELRKAGYQTHLVGRDMHQFPRRKRFGFDHMVHTGDVHPDDRVETLPGHGVEPSWSHGLLANGSAARPWHLADDVHPSHRTVDGALHFLKRRDPDCPFFLVVSFAAPHPPLYPPAFYFDRYLRTGVPDPVIGDWAREPEGLAMGLPQDSHDCALRGEALLSCRAGYYGLINHMDDQIARLLNPISVLDGKTLSNTIILYTTDHGEMLGDHYRFRKSSPYEGSCHIPLIVSAPPSFGLARAAVQETAVTLEDIMPTVLDLAGVPIPPSVDGRSLAPLLRSPGERLAREFIHAENARDRGYAWHLLTDGKQKYIWNTVTGEEQLFDLKNDPKELHDLSTLETSRATLQTWRSRLAEKLAGRPEGFSDGKTLKAGKEILFTLPHVSAGQPGK